ncbi:MAG: COX15/CtaA family protein [Cyclobacteriaceae bacterium]|nr:COX15/CtaA family protein [Cyclobacteriaceae bacterium]
MIRKEVFKKINLYTIIAVYLLILVGGIVRSSGAGMGCPDWPKCFGSYVPPTSVEQLPADYKEVYVAKRIAKNQRLIATLNVLGMDKMAGKLAENPVIYQESEFNAVKTWTEYINRIFGVLIGFLIILTMLSSFSYWHEKRLVTVMAVFSFFLVLFQGWLGSLVVSTNLLPGFVSVHMILALVMVMILLYMQYVIRPYASEKTPYTPLIVLLFLGLLFPQLLLGIEVREMIDTLVMSGSARAQWITSMGLPFYIHRSYSIVLLLVAAYLFYRSYVSGFLATESGRFVKAISTLIVLEIGGGIMMAYGNVPAWVQPLHLLLATLIIGLTFYLFLLALAGRKTAL